MPEEVNRRIVDVTADFNLCYTEHARRNLLASGLPPERIFVVGSPMPEVLLKTLPRIRASRVMERLGLEDKGYFSSRPIGGEPRRGGSFFALMAAVNALAETYGKPILYACHPGRGKFWRCGMSVSIPWSGSIRPWAFTTITSCSCMHTASCPTAVRYRKRAAFSVGRGCRFPPFAFGPVPSGRRHWSAARFFWRASRSIRFWPL